ncbi:f-box domain [Fusarium albosuccineum]|uniref:F-box domain n=1 Tax=Fusarium albosuccineum TaxID=1237068 RepID=A0A8H4KUU2_9HYPO|nr:f-box domain [Fusarium albosuccineum]
MNNQVPASLAGLPSEILHEVVPLLRRSDLLSLRLVNRRLGIHATHLLFRSVRLLGRQAIGHSPGPFRFVALSEDAVFTRGPSELGPLRHLVREATLVTWAGSSAQRQNRWPQGPGDFINALPNLRHFSHLSALHLRFSHLCGYSQVATPGFFIRDNQDFRYRVLDTTFRCLAGTWNVSDQQYIDREINLNYATDYEMAQAVPGSTSMGPLPITTLTVSNLADIPEERLTSSEAFKIVLSLPSLVDLKLHFTKHVQNFDGIWPSGKYKFFDTLPQTWLQPSIATNLKTLSLDSSSHWGWNPKMDFRLVNPTEGGFPNLKVLALGSYVFSHAWQIDWIASQGSKTGGLEELHLDNCYVMYYATHLTPLDESIIVVGKDAEGNDIKVSNEGYQRKDLILLSAVTWENGVRHRSPGTPGPMANTAYPIRWHDILSQWQKSMTALRVFKMGRGTRGKEKDRHCAGINEEDKHQLKYTRCSMLAATQSEWFDHDRELGPYESFDWSRIGKATRAKDRAALELLVSTVNNRGQGVK